MLKNAAVQNMLVVVECFIDLVDGDNLKCSDFTRILRQVDPCSRYGIAIPMK